MKKYFYLFLLFVIVLFSNLNDANSQTYGPLYTDATFDAKAIDVNLAVGAIAGEAGVSNGAASYTIPISVPPGTNGVSPSIAVVYNSMTGNGLLGQGWNLASGGSITRVGKNLFHDGVVGGVNIDANDRFALDGARMIVTNGIYGQANSKYTLEVQNFSSITAYGISGNGPEYFIAVTKDGTIMEYGNSPDSKQESGSGIYVWSLNRVYYKDGNFIDYEYIFNTSHQYLKKISYSFSNNFFTPNVVEFEYMYRDDRISSYIKGLKCEFPFLLEKVKLYYNYDVDFPLNNFASKSFEFKYAFQKTSSYLIELIEKDELNAKLNSTIFKYGEIPDIYNKVQCTTPFNISDDYSASDINGDGIDEVIVYTKSASGLGSYYTNFKILQKSSIPNNNSYSLLSTTALPSNFNVVFKNRVKPNLKIASDFDGNGMNDLLFAKIDEVGPNNNRYKILGDLLLYNSPSSGTTYPAPISIANSSSLWPFTKVPDNGNYLLSGDFNGDGKTDIITFFISDGNNNFSENRIFLNGNSTSLQPGNNSYSWFSNSIWHKALKTYVLDFNGDGRDDIMLIDNDHTEILTYDQSLNKYSSLYHTSYFGYPNKYQLIFFGDFNGDGKTDLLTRGEILNDNSSWTVSLSTGTDFFQEPQTFFKNPDYRPNSYNATNDKIFIADYNGDGQSDIFHSYNHNYDLLSTIDIYYSVSEGFFREQSLNNYFIGVQVESSLPFDSDGDGKTEILNYNKMTVRIST